MWKMDRVVQLICALVGISFLAFAAGVALARAGAGMGWYYGVGLLLVCVGVFRTLEPTAGISVRRFKRLRRRRGKDHTHVPRPTS